MKKIKTLLINYKFYFCLFLVLTFSYQVNAVAFDVNQKTLSIVQDEQQNLHLKMNYNFEDFVTPSVGYAACSDFNDNILQNNYCNIKDRILEIGTNELESILNSAIALEVLYKDDYHVFYHGQRREFCLLQDLYTKLYEIFEKEKLEDFIFIRVPGKDFSKFADPFEFINCYRDQILTANHPYIIFDNNGEVNKSILAVNPSIFGNSISSINKYISECTFKYFVRSANITGTYFMQLCKNMFTLFNVSNRFYKYQDKFQELLDFLASFEAGKTGSLVQIFIPKTFVDQITYRANPGGTPFYGVDKIGHICVTEVLNQYLQTLADYPSFVYKKLFMQERFFSDTDELDQLQFRILLTNKKMLNPHSGIKFFRHCVQTEGMCLYKEKLENLANEMAEELTKRRGFWSRVWSGMKSLFA